MMMLMMQPEVLLTNGGQNSMYSIQNNVLLLKELLQRTISTILILRMSKSRLFLNIIK